MEPVGLSAYALAKALGDPLPRVNDIEREKREDKVGERAARINPHPHGADGSLRPVRGPCWSIGGATARSTGSRPTADL